MEVITQILARYGMNSVDQIRQNIASTGSNASGKTSSEINWETPTPNRVIVYGPPHVYVLETGRGPRKSSQSSGLQGKIADWIGVKPISIEGSIEKAARGITWYMNKHGSKLYREGGRTDILTPVISNTRAINDLQSELADNLLNLTADKIQKGVN